MNELFTFDKDDSELALTMTDAVSSKRQIYEHVKRRMKSNTLAASRFVSCFNLKKGEKTIPTNQ